MKFMDPVLDRAERRAAEGKLRRYPVGAGRAAAGALLLVAAAIAYWQPRTVFTLSVSQARGICSSVAGQLAQAVSGPAQASCVEVGRVAGFIAVMAVAGAVLVAWGGLAMHRRSD